MLERPSNLQLSTVVNNAGPHLTGQERQLITNFRAMDDFQKSAILGLSHCYVGTEPAAPAPLRLVSSGTGRARL